VHYVFWLKNPNSKEDLGKLLAGLRTLAGIDTVRGHPHRRAGGCRTARRRRRQLQRLGNRVLRRRGRQNTYQVHPIHKQVVADCEHLWQRMVVYDLMAFAP
jgi:hypothetical protein